MWVFVCETPFWSFCFKLGKGRTLQSFWVWLRSEVGSWAACKLAWEQTSFETDFWKIKLIRLDISMALIYITKLGPAGQLWLARGKTLLKFASNFTHFTSHPNRCQISHFLRTHKISWLKRGRKRRISYFFIFNEITSVNIEGRSCSTS